MVDISYAKDPAALLRGAENLVVVAPKATFKPRRFPKSLVPKELADLAVDLAADVKPGDLGAIGTTLTGSSPRRLQVGVLPDQVSRYNAASRPESVRRVVAAAKTGSGTTAVLAIVDSDAHVLAVVNAIARAVPTFSLKSAKRERRRLRILVADRRGNPLPIDRFAREVASATQDAARLVDTPPTDLDPAAFVREARAMLRGIPNVRTKEIRGKALLDAGLRGIHAVGRTAVSEPRVLIGTYAPPRASGGHVALVGKGVTFDTGGLQIKPRGGMETMKCDMGGAAAVLGTFRALARAKLRQRVSVVLCLAENAVGPPSYKPDDVLEMHSGKTVEINNTDAEGRLLLADGVSYSARVLKADTIFDAATLTGAQMVATGALHAAIVTNDAKLERLVVDSGHGSGDLVHPLPFAPEFYRQEFQSPIADMRNSVKNRNNAQASCAAEFVHWHLPSDETRWCHVDMAGPAFRNSRGTGYGVALLAEAVRRLA